MFKRIGATVLDILYPRNCHICGKILKGRNSAFDENLCSGCVAAMKEADKEPFLLPAPQHQGPFPADITTCYAYEGPTRELIHKFKYDNRPYLSRSILKLMSLVLNQGTFHNIDALVPIPLHPAKAREREFNQSQLLAEDLGRLYDKPVKAVIKKIKHTASQTSFSMKDRFSNLDGCFEITAPHLVTGKNILVIDDVATTGATVAEAARTLRKAGALSVSALAFAKG